MNAEGDAAAVVGLNARYADLTVVGQANPDDPQNYPNPGLPAEVALDAGRPVLVVPYVGAAHEVGRNVLVAWNGSREASRAVHDALPLLQAAEQVSVLGINPVDTRHIAGFDISAQLARHGVEIEASKTVSSDVSVGDVLLSRAADLDADLIVMGAYGHSRLRELVLGGATRLILATMTMPVFMAH